MEDMAATPLVAVLDRTVPATDSVIMKELRPIVRKLEPYNDTASLCADLSKIQLLRTSPSIASATTADILGQLVSIYDNAKTREAATNVAGNGVVAPRISQTAIEIRDAILYAGLLPIDDSGMKVYSVFVPDVQNPGYVTSIIIRPEDEAFWHRCIDLSMDNHPVCGVGNPGIGKTTTTLFLMQHIIMNLKAPVVYTIRSAGPKDIFYELVPVFDNGGQVINITVNVYNLVSQEKANAIPSMTNPGAFYIVDPGLFVGSCNDTNEPYDAKFIMAASNNSEHWGGENFTKSRVPNAPTGFLSGVRKAGVMVFASLWSGPQLIAAKPYVYSLKDLDDDEIWRRFRIVGGSMRSITEFNEATFTQSLNGALNLTATTVQELVEGVYKFDFKKGSVRSILAGLGPLDEGLQTFKITLKSDFVEECLAQKFIRMSWYSVLEEDNAGNHGNLFESYLRARFSKEQVSFSKEEVRQSLRTRPPPPPPPPPKKPTNEKKNYQPVDGGMTIGSIRKIVRVSNMIEAVRSDPSQDNLYYSKNEGEPLIDMIYRVDNGYDAIQATIAVTHGSKSDKIATLKTQLGLQDSQILRIFFAVPLCRYGKFETTPVNPLLSQPSLHNVSIYHLAVSANEG